MSRQPDHIYDPDDWEFTCTWEDRATLEPQDHISVGEVKRYATLLNGPDKFAAKVVVSRDENGDPNETQIVWFDSEADARAAASK